MDRLLTDQEIADLTGLVQASAQKRWLEQNGIHYFQRNHCQGRKPGNG
jgi:hypothetical protein